MSGKSIFTKGDSKPSTTHEEISAFLGKESLFEGKMTFQGVFRLEGKFEGEIFDSGTLIVAESAIVKGKIGVNTIIISGQVEGEVHVHEKTEIHSTGQFHGNLLTPTLIVNEGGVLEGHCQMKSPPDREERPLPFPHKEDQPLSA